MNYIYSFQVSWIRRRDWSILSSGNSAFTKDARFSLLHRPGDSDWTLIIKYLQERDEGTYVCQVSFHLKLHEFVYISDTEILFEIRNGTLYVIVFWKLLQQKDATVMIYC